MASEFDRRKFLKAASLSAAAFTIVPRTPHSLRGHGSANKKQRGQECLGIPGPVKSKPDARFSSAPAPCPDGSS